MLGKPFVYENPSAPDESFAMFKQHVWVGLAILGGIVFGILVLKAWLFVDELNAPSRFKPAAFGPGSAHYNVAKAVLDEHPVAVIEYSQYQSNVFTQAYSGGGIGLFRFWRSKSFEIRREGSGILIVDSQVGHAGMLF